jgi:hypothetical protein
MLEGPPAQPNGGALNSTLTVGNITLGAPLAPGASVNVQFLLGIQQTGLFRFFINVEALTDNAPASPVKGTSGKRPKLPESKTKRKSEGALGARPRSSDKAEAPVPGNHLPGYGRAFEGHAATQRRTERRLKCNSAAKRR